MYTQLVMMNSADNHFSGIVKNQLYSAGTLVVLSSGY